MSSKSMQLSVWVRLKDRFSGKLKGIMRGLNRLGNVARRLGAVAGIVAGISFAGPAQEAAAFDQNLRDIAVTSNVARDEVDAWVESQRRAYEDLALLTGQHSSDVAKTAGELRQAGLGDDLITQLMPTISKSAKAASADMSDMGKVAFALSKNLGIPAERMQDALAKLVVAGKEGRFELKEMAKFFPALTSQLVNLGVKGEEAVAMLASGLQVAILGASDPAQAANNFQNFLQKILAPDTVKRFAKSGVDILGVMQDAATKGINPIEAVIAKTEDLTGVSAKVIGRMMDKAKANGLEGAEALANVHEQLKRIGAAGKLSELFGDQQVKAFLLPFLANIDEYKRIKKAVDETSRSVIDRDFAIQNDGPSSQLKTFKELSVQAGREIGDSFNAWLPTINAHLLDLREYLKGVEQKMPGVKDKVLAFGSAAVLAAVGLGILGLALPFVASGASALAAAFAFAFSWVGLAVALLVAGAYLIISHWEKIGPFFEKLWLNIKTIAIAAWFGIERTWKEGIAWFKNAWNGIKQSADDTWNSMGNMLDAAIEGIKAKVMALVDWFKNLPTMIISAIGSIDLASVFSWGDPPEWIKRLVGGAYPGPAAIIPDVKKPPPNVDIQNRAANVNKGAKFPGFQPSPTVQVGGQITIKVDGPGKVTAVQSSNPKVPINKGRTTGRI